MRGLADGLWLFLHSLNCASNSSLVSRNRPACRDKRLELVDCCAPSTAKGRLVLT